MHASDQLYSMCVRLQYNYKVIISSLINLSISKTGYVYSIIDYTTLLAYLKMYYYFKLLYMDQQDTLIIM